MKEPFEIAGGSNSVTVVPREEVFAQPSSGPQVT